MRYATTIIFKVTSIFKKLNLLLIRKEQLKGKKVQGIGQCKGDNF